MSSRVKQFFKEGRKIIGVVRNYKAHSNEMNAKPTTKPYFFLKPTTSYLVHGDPENQYIELPSGQEVHHEVELGVVIGTRGRDIHHRRAMNHVAGYALALDMTARTIQAELKENSLPWTVAKGMDTFCPVSNFIDKSFVKDPHNLELWLKVDGELKQRGFTYDMIYRIPYLISEISKVMTLEEGDLIITGTPQGVGPVKPGQVITAGLVNEDNETLAMIEFKTKERPFNLLHFLPETEDRL